MKKTFQVNLNLRKQVVLQLLNLASVRLHLNVSECITLVSFSSTDEWKHTWPSETKSFPWYNTSFCKAQVNAAIEIHKDTHTQIKHIIWSYAVSPWHACWITDLSFSVPHLLWTTWQTLNQTDNVKKGRNVMQFPQSRKKQKTDCGAELNSPCVRFSSSRISWNSLRKLLLCFRKLCRGKIIIFLKTQLCVEWCRRDFYLEYPRSRFSVCYLKYLTLGHQEQAVNTPLTFYHLLRC